MLLLASITYSVVYLSIVGSTTTSTTKVVVLPTASTAATD